ncbi:MAG: T9SS type A sorting domain-containing protein [Candidatus Kapaibacterium sp.]
MYYLRLLFPLLLFGISSTLTGQTFEYSLDQSYEGWIPDFADYSIGDIDYELAHELTRGIAVEGEERGILLSGVNYSDDLFLFVKRKITGLQPNRRYSILFQIGLVTPEGITTIGGSDLTLKCGATRVEPMKIRTKREGSSDYYLMNIDKGNQTAPGSDMDTLGQVRHPFEDYNNHLIVKENTTHLFEMTTDENGEVWCIVGAESAFESNVAMFITSIGISFSLTSDISVESPVSSITLIQSQLQDYIQIGGVEAGEIESLSVFDLTGRERYRAENPESTIVPTEDLNPGLYYLVVQIGGVRIVHRFVVVR